VLAVVKENALELNRFCIIWSRVKLVTKVALNLMVIAKPLGFYFARW